MAELLVEHGWKPLPRPWLFWTSHKPHPIVVYQQTIVFRQLFAGHVVRFSADGQEEKHATNTNFIVNCHWHFAPEQGVETGYDSKLHFTFGLCCLLNGYISFLLVWFWNFLQFVFFPLGIRTRTLKRFSWWCLLIVGWVCALICYPLYSSRLSQWLPS